MKNLIKIVLVIWLSLGLVGCGVFFATGNWWNLDYAPYDELWVHPKLNKQDAKLISIQCSDLAEGIVSGVKDFNKLPESERDTISKKFSHEQNQRFFSYKNNVIWIMVLSFILEE